MDCSAEEQLVRMKLEPHQDVISLSFDLPNRQLLVLHKMNIETLSEEINSLNLGSSHEGTIETEESSFGSERIEKKQLLVVLLINLAFFVLEIVTGFLANSMGLVADSLDMLADAMVYGLSLYAVGKMTGIKIRIAKFSGYLQLTLAIIGFLEVLRRFFGFEEVPEFKTMIVISTLALIGNGVTMFLLQKVKSREAHIQASLIFTNNDILVNLGVIIAGIAVYLTQSKYPDLVVGSLIFVFVSKGAFRILKLSK